MGYTTNNISRPNCVIMVISTIICNIMLLAAEAERGELFYNYKELEALRTTLIEMGHPQPATEIITYIST